MQVPKKTIPSRYDYSEAWIWLQQKGKDVYELEVEYDGETMKGETILNTLKKFDELELQIIIRRDKKGCVTSINFSLPIKTNWRKSMEELERYIQGWFGSV